MLNPDWVEACEVLCPARMGKPFGSMREVAIHIAIKHGITLQQLRGDSRRKHIVYARREAFAICYRQLGRSLTQVGRFFGDRDHATVLTALRRYEGKR